MKSYTVNEIFRSPQGEGARVGTLNVFVRFSFCNLRCTADGEAGFDCDTDFNSGTRMSRDELLQQMEEVGDKCRSVIFTGGEPALQLDEDLVRACHDKGWFVAVETNGTKPLPTDVDWISCSPKTAEHTIVHEAVNELRYVRHKGQAIPQPKAHAQHHYLSPAFQADGSVRKEDLQWCIRLTEENPTWAVSVQAHKLWWAVR